MATKYHETTIAFCDSTPYHCDAGAYLQEFEMPKKIAIFLNALLPSGWKASFNPAEDESVDDEYEIRHAAASLPRFSIQCTLERTYGVNEYLYDAAGNLKGVRHHPTVNDIGSATNILLDLLNKNPAPSVETQTK